MWRRFNGKKINEPILNAVEEAIKKENAKGHKLKVCIGTDSQVKGNHIEFATVIVFIRKSHGGFMYIQNEKIHSNISLKERMLLEVSKSIECGYDLCNLLDQYNVELEVHADINTDPQFKSNTALSEAMGYILSMGFVFKAKPDAFASTSCADKFVH